jgi:hypothetical protein
LERVCRGGWLEADCWWYILEEEEEEVEEAD